MFSEILNSLGIVQKLYDYIKIIDPESSNVYENIDGKVVLLDEEEAQSSLIKDSVPILAYNKNEIMYKIDCRLNNINLITAVPMTWNGRNCVLELKKSLPRDIINLNIDKHSKIDYLIDDLKYISTHDALTNVFNRRYIDEQLPLQIERSIEHDDCLSLIFADLDYFKKINDEFGHRAGDYVLKVFAEEMNKHIRMGTDWVARYGGEEFLICLPDTSFDKARIIAERIRESIEKKEFVFENKIIRITCSIGVKSLCGEDVGTTYKSIIEEIDKNLYRAKNTGRNRVV